MSIFEFAIRMPDEHDHSSSTLTQYLPSFSTVSPRIPYQLTLIGVDVMLIKLIRLMSIDVSSTIPLILCKVNDEIAVILSQNYTLMIITHVKIGIISVFHRIE